MKSVNVFECLSIAMTGEWVAYELTETNLYIFQARDDDNNINMSHNANGAPYFTIKAGQSLPVSSFNLDQGQAEQPHQSLYFRAPAGVVLEILRQLQP